MSVSVNIVSRQELLDRISVAGDVSHAAAEFVGGDFGSRMVFNHDEVWLAVDVAHRDAAVRLHRVATQSLFVLLRRRRTADRKNLELTERNVVVGRGDDDSLLAVFRELHHDIEFVGTFPRGPGDSLLVVEGFGQQLPHVTNLFQCGEQSWLSFVGVSSSLLWVAMDEPIDELSDFVRQFSTVAPDVRKRLRHCLRYELLDRFAGERKSAG